VDTGFILSFASKADLEGFMSANVPSTSSRLHPVAQRALLLFVVVAGACASSGEKLDVAAPMSGGAPASGYQLVSQVSGAEEARPPDGVYRQALDGAYKKWKGLAEGKNADYIPILAKVDPKLFGIALVTVQGGVYEIGSARNEFSIQSVSKPFTLARAMEAVGLEGVQKRIGVNATGQAFNSILAIELNHSQKRPEPGNPFVNAGAITTVDLLPAANAQQKWDVILGMYSAFAGRRLTVNQEVYRSESETNTHNRAIVALLKDYEVIKGAPAEALDLYTRQCSVNVNARDLAVMGGTLANGGRNPVTGQQIVSAATASHILGVMATAGLYETSGDWLVMTGLPAKSGVGGGIVAVLPGRFAVAVFSPPLDEAGNSVRGQKAIQTIIERLGGGVFASRAIGPAAPVAKKPAAPGPAMAGKGTN
jgi:glutaminase